MAKIQARPFRLALCQLAPTSSNKPANIDIARRAIAQAAASTPKPDLIVLPEVWNSPYSVAGFRPYSEVVPAVGSKGDDKDGETVKAMREMAWSSKSWLIGGSISELEEGTDKIYNTATVYDPEGTLVAKHRKVHLFDIDIPGKQVFKESETLSPGANVTMFETPFGKIGLGICYDIRFPELTMIAARQGCVAMIYPSAFNTTTGPLHWTLLQRARAVDNQIYVSMCSPSRNNGATYQAWGHSMVVNPLGEILCEADENEAIMYADIDPDMLATTRQNIPVTIQRRFDVYPDVAKTA